MAFSVNPLTFVITIPQSDLTWISGTLYEMDTDVFRLALKDWEDDATGGITLYKTHLHNTEVTIVGVTYARAINILAPYSITFEDSQYTVLLKGSNNNIFDVANGILNQNQVQVIPNNSAGLVVVTEAATSITEQDKLDIADREWEETLGSHITENSAATAVKAATYRIGNVTLDTVNGTAGTGWAIGTHFKPSNNLTDALTIMLYGKVSDLTLMSDITVEAIHDISSKVVRTIGLMGIDVTLATGCASHKTTFKNINLSGVVTAGNQHLIYDSSIGNLENFQGIMNNVSFNQGSEITLNGWANIIQGTAGGDPTNEVEINIGTASLNISHWTGNLKLMGKTGTDRTVINCDSGNIIIDSTCTAGIIQLLGTGRLEADNSGAGCQVDTDGLQNIENTASAVWDEDMTTHTATDSAGEKVNKIDRDVGDTQALIFA